MTPLLLAICAMCLLAAIHPFLTYPLSLWILKHCRARRCTPFQSGQPPGSFAICMCAYNEEQIIDAKIHNLLALREREPALQILIYVDAATDRTAEILGRYASQLELHVGTQRRGKTHGMNLLCTRASAEILVFTDANVMLDPDCLDDLRRHFADPQIGCVCGNLTYTNAAHSITAASGSAYWRFEQAVKKLESELGSMMGADGSIFAVRRQLRQAPPDHIIDDMYVSLMVLCSGLRVVQADDVRGYEESACTPREEFSRKVRIACQAFNVHRMIWPRLRRLDAFVRYQYVSHKLMRWLSIYFLAAAALAFLAALCTAGMMQVAVMLVLAVALAAGLGRLWSIRPIVQAFDLILALTGAGFGVWRSLRGEQYQTWTPAASIRRRSGA